ncbi:MAG: BON domain-containing protein [Bacillota bacterium]
MPKRSIGELESQVVQALAAEQLLQPYDLKVVVDRGRVVHLQGIVDVLAEKIKAEEIVRSIPGVTGVENSVTVCTDGDINDDAVRFEVAEELHADPQLVNIGVDVYGGVAHLKGKVDSLATERKAVRTAAKARGVRGIRSNLKIEESWPDDSATLANKVDRVLAGFPQLTGSAIRPEADRGVVTLTGSVAKAEDMELAVEMAGTVEGVRSVRNELSVNPDLESIVVTEIMDELMDDPFVREAPLTIRVVSGEIQVEGAVENKEQKRRIEQAVRETAKNHRDQIIGINNKLIISPS